ncbi:hypothetical protein J2S74_002742 [Evansella vedderi]|uniref:GT-D fold-like domain-containing protein n=1 Tax=Evansella vedderi TaxID=38282 RepID=A0ABT9ZVU1_9BACI|nr:GT-D fold domain-containing glycosyltransferase [Evansella vedderi]MDQ0255360.1 hypothetical protein [Evansella vedderi]
MNRFERLEAIYQRKGIWPEKVMEIIDHAIENNHPLSLIRLGDVPVTFLANRWHERWRGARAKKIFPFMGIPYPPPAALMKDMHTALVTADIVGLRTEGKGTYNKCRDYLKEHHIKPPYITNAFINDDLYKRGYFHELIKKNKVVLVGREAINAAKRLKKRRLIVSNTYNLESWEDIEPVFSELNQSKGSWDIALVGAGVPGLILSSRLAREQNKVALEIGHVMDGLAYPEIWKQKDKRRIFRDQFYDKQKGAEE